ncbi:hypothetical protein F66182_8528 [Fusarium sp. NRRL 66182]|nr:hypothetical protein F66182_8528 [Fusarium sp. NRRL 66182]
MADIPLMPDLHANLEELQDLYNNHRSPSLAHADIPVQCPQPPNGYDCGLPPSAISTSDAWRVYAGHAALTSDAAMLPPWQSSIDVISAIKTLHCRSIISRSLQHLPAHYAVFDNDAIQRTKTGLELMQFASLQMDSRHRALLTSAMAESESSLIECINNLPGSPAFRGIINLRQLCAERRQQHTQE